MTRREVVRDPLWNNIRLDHDALAVVDTPAFQRLRYVRQLGHAFLVYPGATHTRFEHALGANHLCRRVLAELEETLGRPPVSPDAARRMRLATLLHDIGHYPFSHALEEAGLPSHETLAERHLTDGPLGEALVGLGVAAAELLPLIRGEAAVPLAGVVSGPLDVDKLDYLSRDAFACGVPYGIIDVDRLIAALTVTDGPHGPVLALTEKGVAPLESLLFAKYQMYRNVYWHHAVRAATVMFQRLVRATLAAGGLAVDDIARAADDGLVHELERRDATGLARALRERRLAKRALDLPGTSLPARPTEWAATDPDLVARVEARLARDLGLAAGELFLDFPAKPGMLAVDAVLMRRDGATVPLDTEGAGAFPGLPRVADELYRAARRLRVFTLRPATVPAAGVTALLEMSAEEVARRVDGGAALLSEA